MWPHLSVVKSTYAGQWWRTPSIPRHEFLNVSSNVKFYNFQRFLSKSPHCQRGRIGYFMEVIPFSRWWYGWSKIMLPGLGGEIFFWGCTSLRHIHGPLLYGLSGRLAWTLKIDDIMSLSLLPPLLWSFPPLTSIVLSTGSLLASHVCQVLSNRFWGDEAKRAGIVSASRHHPQENAGYSRTHKMTKVEESFLVDVAVVWLGRAR